MTKQIEDRDTLIERLREQTEAGGSRDDEMQKRINDLKLELTELKVAN